MPTTRIAVLGAAGRMGRAVITAAQGLPQLKLGAALERAGAPELGADAGALAGLPKAGVAIAADLASVIGDFDVLIDFTRPEATLAVLDGCVAAGKGMVIGTTGF